MKQTMDQMILCSVMPNLNLLDEGTEFIVQDLVPPILWEQYTDHKGIGITFKKLVNALDIRVKCVSTSGTARYKKF